MGMLSKAAGLPIGPFGPFGGIAGAAGALARPRPPEDPLDPKNLKLDGNRYLYDADYRKRFDSARQFGLLQTGAESIQKDTSLLGAMQPPDLADVLKKQGRLFQRTGSRAGSFITGPSGTAANPGGKSLLGY